MKRLHQLRLAVETMVHITILTRHRHICLQQHNEDDFEKLYHRVSLIE